MTNIRPFPPNVYSIVNPNSPQKSQALPISQLEFPASHFFQKKFPKMWTQYLLLFFQTVESCQKSGRFSKFYFDL